MYCPVCGAEYRQGFSMCSDCQVALVPDPPRSSSVESPAADQALVTVWAGDDPLKHGEICEALEGNGIPARTLRREERSFNLAVQPGFEVFVPAGFAESAREVVRALAVADEVAAQAPDSGSGEFVAEDHDEDDEMEARDLFAAPNLDPHVAAGRGTEFASGLHWRQLGDHVPIDGGHEHGFSWDAASGVRVVF